MAIDVTHIPNLPTRMKNGTLLWIDDEIELLRPHILFLQGKHYDVDTVSNGRDAVDRCRQNTYDLILLDENMPGLSGLETLNLIKEVSPGVPVVMVTKSEEEDIMNQAIGAKIADYLIKPVNPSQVLLTLKKNIHQRDLVSEATNTGYQQNFGELGGDCQVFNTATILTAILILRKLKKEGKKGQSTYMISDENVREGFLHVCEKTGLMGRWQRINEAPLTICDTGHNTGGLQYIAPQLAATPHRHLHMVIGMVGDKDVRGSLSLLPSDKDTTYYFTQATVKRAMPAQEICRIGNELGLQGAAFNDVMEAYQNALSNAQADDLIYIGGSSFIVADFLTHYGR